MQAAAWSMREPFVRVNKIAIRAFTAFGTHHHGYRAAALTARIRFFLEHRSWELVCGSLLILAVFQVPAIVSVTVRQCDLCPIAR